MFGVEYKRSKMITSGKIEHSVECCFSILLKPFQRVKNVWTPPLSEKPCWEKHFSFVYVWSILSEIFENNPFKFVTNNAKGFSMDVVSRTSFMILLHHSFNYSCKSIHILVYLLLEGKRSWTCFDACTFYPHITVTLVCGHSFQDWKLWKEIYP